MMVLHVYKTTSTDLHISSFSSKFVCVTSFYIFVSVKFVHDTDCYILSSYLRFVHATDCYIFIIMKTCGGGKNRKLGLNWGFSMYVERLELVM